MVTDRREKDGGRLRRNHLGAFVLAFTSSLARGRWRAGRAGDATEAKGPPDAERLVADAMQAELGGNVAQRRVLLAWPSTRCPIICPPAGKAARCSPAASGCRSTRPKPKPPPIRSAPTTSRSAIRPHNRSTVSSPLARWCRKNAFDEEAKFHWRTVLAHDPNHKEALRALGVEWFGGQLMSHADVEKAKTAVRERKAAVKEFAPRVALGADAIGRRSQIAERGARRDSPCASRRPCRHWKRSRSTAIWRRTPTLNNACGSARRCCRRVAAIADPEATHSLVRHALFSQLKSVRESAIAALKQRPVHDYLPQLLGALTMPIESSYRVVTDDDGSVHYFHSLYREGPTADWSFESRRSAMQHDLRGPKFVHIDDRIRGEVTNLRFGSSPDPRVQAEIGREASRSQQKFSAQANRGRASGRVHEPRDGNRQSHDRRLARRHDRTKPGRKSARLVGLVAAVQRIFARRRRPSMKLTPRIRRTATTTRPNRTPTASIRRHRRGVNPALPRAHPSGRKPGCGRSSNWRSATWCSRKTRRPAS